MENLKKYNTIGKVITNFHKEFSGNYIFPIGAFIAVNGVIISPSFSSIVIFFLVLTRLALTKNKRIYKSTLICILLSLVWFSSLKLQENAEIKRIRQNSMETCKVKLFPDDIKIDGNQLSAKGYIINGRKKSRVQLFYQLKSQEEQIKWRQNNQTIVANLSWEITQPDTQRNINGFSYSNFLKTQKIYMILTVSQIVSIDSYSDPIGCHPIQWLREKRKQSMLYVERHFPVKTSAYMKSLLFGMKDQDFRQIHAEIKNLGILHLFSLSGMHVAFFLSLLRYLLLRLSVTKEHVFWLEGLFLLGYFFFTGSLISVGRSILQRLVSQSNRKWNWNFSSLDCWGVALSIGCFFNPYLLVTLAGQFSYFLSFLLVFIPEIVRGIKVSILRSFVTTFLLSMGALPLICLYSYEWNILSIFLTFALVPMFQYFLLPTLFILFIISFIYEGVGVSIFGVGIEKIITSMDKIFQYFHRIDLFQVVVGKIPFLLLILYIFLFLYVLQQLADQKFRFRSDWGIFLVFFLIMNSKYLNPFGIVAIVDIGQGDSIFIQRPFHKANLLIDTGGRVEFPLENWQKRKQQTANGEKTLLPFLKSKGVKKIDYLFVTHGDVDHMGDVGVLSQSIKIEKLCFP